MVRNIIILSCLSQAPILDSPFNTIPSDLTSPRLLSRTFPEKGSLIPNSNSDFIQSTYGSDFETYANVCSHTIQQTCFSPSVLPPLSFGRSSQPMSSAPEVGFRRIQHSNRKGYVKSWSLDATGCRPQLFFSNDRSSTFVSPRVRSFIPNPTIIRWPCL